MLASPKRPGKGALQSAPILDHLAYLPGGKWQRIIFVGSIAYKKIDMVKGQTKLPQSGDIKLIEPSVQAIHEMTTTIKAVFMLGAE